MAEYSGLVEGVTEALIGTYRGAPVHAPGRVFTDLAVAVADGADAISGISVLGDRQDLFGPVASMPTTWRVLDRVTEDSLPEIRAARARARAAAWAGGAGPDLDAGCAWTSTPPSRLRTARRRTPRRPGRRRSGSIRCCASWTVPTWPAGRHWPGCCAVATPGRTPPRTTSPCRTGRWMRCPSTPAPPRCGARTWTGPRVLARSDSAGATHAFAQACVDRGV